MRTGVGWTVDTELSALLVEVTDLVNVILMHVYTKEGTRIREPLHVPRPAELAEEAEELPIATISEIESFVRAEGGEFKATTKKPKRKK
jgi:hypothetical protein